jgi:hypothetical protein
MYSALEVARPSRIDFQTASSSADSLSVPGGLPGRAEAIHTNPLVQSIDINCTYFGGGFESIAYLAILSEVFTHFKSQYAFAGAHAQCNNHKRAETKDVLNEIIRVLSKGIVGDVAIASGTIPVAFSESTPVRRDTSKIVELTRERRCCPTSMRSRAIHG